MPRPGSGAGTPGSRSRAAPKGGSTSPRTAGATWRRLSRGLPSPDRQDIGRIGLAISPHDPDVVYAQVAASDGGYGFYASTDRGESWEKRSDYFVTDPQYYMEIFADPHRPGGSTPWTPTPASPTTTAGPGGG